MPTAEDFKHELFWMMAEAQKAGNEFVEVKPVSFTGARVGRQAAETIGCRTVVRSCGLRLPLITGT